MGKIQKFGLKAYRRRLRKDVFPIIRNVKRDLAKSKDPKKDVNLAALLLEGAMALWNGIDAEFDMNNKPMEI